MLLITIIRILCYMLVCIMLSGLSTTGTFRLTRGSTTKIWDKTCRCDSCGCEIPLHEQIPVISYFLCKGKCSKCGARFSAWQTVQEAILLIVFTVSGIITGFSWICAAFDLGFYELFKLAVIIIMKRRRDGFAASYFLGLLGDILIYGVLALFLFVTESL